MSEMNSIRFYYVVFWIRFRPAPPAAGRRERLLSRFGLVAGRHGAVALAVDGTADRLCALLGIHPGREPGAVIQGIREELKRLDADLVEEAGLDWEEDYAAIPLAPEEAAALLDVASSPGFPAPDVPDEDWWEAAFGTGPHPWEFARGGAGHALRSEGEATS